MRERHTGTTPPSFWAVGSFFSKVKVSGVVSDERGVDDAIMRD
jgi:hypothetical protein